MNPYIGHDSQIYGVEEHRLVGGKGDGMRLLEVHNGIGLDLTVAPDRCADIPRLRFAGINLSYMSACGYVAPTYYDNVETAWLRRQIGIVLQENFLFAGTISENIAITKPNATEEEILRAARLAGADDFIQEMPQKYDTFVGERGSLLSGGQRQRISIARALLLDPKILIFDEATSALDTESEQTILKNIDQIAAGRTMIMIAHRLSTVKDCNAIVAMDGGRIVEAGTHEALMNHKGYYYHLYATQE